MVNFVVAAGANKAMKINSIIRPIKVAVDEAVDGDANNTSTEEEDNYIEDKEECLNETLATGVVSVTHCNSSLSSCCQLMPYTAV